MASSGKEAWEKHFKDKGAIQTVMKKTSPIVDEKGKNIGVANAGDVVTALESREYLDKYPIEHRGTIGFVTFNNLQKPLGKRVSGIKLKPQDFKFFKGTTNYGATELAEKLINEIEEREDLPPGLKTFLIKITEHHSGIDKSALATIRKVYPSVEKGLAETQKDYGEMLGAIACVLQDILPVKVSKSSKISFPTAGNEPLVDYYIVNKDLPGGRLSISAKSGETTNTLKPKDVLDLLDKQGKTKNWNRKPVYKFMQLVVDKSAAEFPFHAINLIEGDDIVGKEALEEVSKNFKKTNFGSNKYQVFLFAKLLQHLKLDIKKPPTIGQLFYATEKHVISVANKKYPPADIFRDATAGVVTYVKFAINDSAPQGEFSIISSEPIKEKKKDVYWRSKNGTTRASDKIGLQP